jgi:acid stress-induced BolA-like protein IbaG/YrbA
MAMEITEIKKLIEGGIANSQAIVTGDGGKYEATVISAAFEGLSMLKEHQLVYKTVNAQIASGELHALTIKAFTPDEWEQNKSS